MTAATKATKSPPPAETFRARKIQPPTTKLYAESFKGSNHLAPHPGGGAGGRTRHRLTTD